MKPNPHPRQEFREAWKWCFGTIFLKFRRPEFETSLESNFLLPSGNAIREACPQLFFLSAFFLYIFLLFSSSWIFFFSRTLMPAFLLPQLDERGKEYHFSCLRIKTFWALYFFSFCIVAFLHCHILFGFLFPIIFFFYLIFTCIFKFYLFLLFPLLSVVIFYLVFFSLLPDISTFPQTSLYFFFIFIFRFFFTFFIHYNQRRDFLPGFLFPNHYLHYLINIYLSHTRRKWEKGKSK